MRVPYTWLREYCDAGLGAEELAERLAMTGTEVERVATVGPPSPEGFVVGRVLSAEQHPDADRLRVCTVDTGDGAPEVVTRSTSVPVIERRSASARGSSPGSHSERSHVNGTRIRTAPASARRCRRTCAGRGPRT